MVRRAERRLETERTEPVEATHLGVDLVVVDSPDQRLVETLGDEMRRQGAPGILEARRRDDQRIVEVDEDERNFPGPGKCGQAPRLCVSIHGRIIGFATPSGQSRHRARSLPDTPGKRAASQRR